MFGPAEPTKLFDACWNLIVGKKEKKEDTEVSDRFPNGRPSLAAMSKSNKTSVKRTYGFDEIALVAETDKNGNQKVTRTLLALSIKQTYDLNDTPMEDMRKSMMTSMRSMRGSMKSMGKSGRFSSDANADAGVHWS